MVTTTSMSAPTLERCVPKPKRYYPIKQTPEERLWAKVTKAGPDDCWVWNSTRGNRGHGSFHLHGQHVPAHKFAYEMVNGPILSGLIMRHKCDVPWCVNPSHLETGTYKQNSQDMVSRGRCPNNRGEKSGRAAQTSEQVKLIREMYASGGKSQKEVAVALSLPLGHVNSAIYYWKHIQ